MILEGLRYQLGLIFAPKIRHWMTTFCLQTIYFSSCASAEVWNYRSKTSCMEVQNINNSANYSTSQQHETIFAIISVRWPNFQQPIFHAKIMALISLWIVYYECWMKPNEVSLSQQQQHRVSWEHESTSVVVSVASAGVGYEMMLRWVPPRTHHPLLVSFSVQYWLSEQADVTSASAVLKLLLNQARTASVKCSLNLQTNTKSNCKVVNLPLIDLVTKWKLWNFEAKFVRKKTVVWWNCENICLGLRLH